MKERERELRWEKLKRSFAIPSTTSDTNLPLSSPSSVHNIQHSNEVDAGNLNCDTIKIDINLPPDISFPSAESESASNRVITPRRASPRCRNLTQPR